MPKWTVRGHTFYGSSGYWDTKTSSITPFQNVSLASDSDVASLKQRKYFNSKLKDLAIAIGKVWLPILPDHQLANIQRFLPGTIA
jgi:hypothetical protein